MVHSSSPNALSTWLIFLCPRWCRLGSRSQGYQPVAPRPIAAGPLCSAIYFRPSPPEALHVTRHKRLLSAKDGITDEKWLVNLACDPDFHVNHRVLLHAVNLRHETDGFTSPPKEGILWTFSPENSDGFGRVSPYSRFPAELASILLLAFSLFALVAALSQCLCS
jgi:hypothetical protein